MDTNELEQFYKYAERNIHGYKRPADWQTRLERVKERGRNPNGITFEGHTKSKRGEYNPNQ